MVCCKDFTITVYTFLICIVLTVNIISYFGSLHRHCVIIHMCLAHVVVYVLQRGCYNTLLFIQVTLKAYTLQMPLYAKRIQVLYICVYLITFYYLTMYCTCIWPLWSHCSLSQRRFWLNCDVAYYYTSILRSTITRKRIAGLKWTFCSCIQTDLFCSYIILLLYMRGLLQVYMPPRFWSSGAKTLLGQKTIILYSHIFGAVASKHSMQSNHPDKNYKFEYTVYMFRIGSCLAAILNFLYLFTLPWHIH